MRGVFAARGEGAPRTRGPHALQMGRLLLVKAPYERLYRARSCYCVVRCNCWSCLRVLRLLRVVLSKYSCRFLQCRNVMFARFAVFHFVLLFFAFCLCFNPTKAYADTYIGGPYKNVNDAGLSYLGYDYDALETEFEHTALNELVATPDKYPDYTFWVDSFYEQFDPLNLNPGYYWSKYDGMQFVDLTDRARADVVNAVKAAEQYNTSGDYHLISLKDWAPHEHTGALDMDYVAVPNAIYSVLSDYAKSNNQDILVRIGSNYKYVILTVNPDDVTFYESALGRDYVVGWNRSFNTSLTESVYTASEISTLNGKKCLIARNIAPRVLTASAVIDGTYPTYAYGWDYPSMGPVLPDEPDEPQLPVTLPDEPTPPSLPEPDLPDEPVVPDNPDLSDLLAALDEHCQHIQLAIYNGLSDYYDSITDYYEDVVKWLADTYKYYDNELDKRFQVLFNFLRSTNQYLKNIDDNVAEILDKLDDLSEQIGLGDIPDSYDNNNVATDGSTALSNAYNSIRNKFPFSVIDNLLTLVTSLKHDAVAPVINIPVGNPFGDEPYMVEMDFSDWSDLAAIVRTGEIIAAYLGMSKSAIKMWTGGEGEAA